MISDQIEEFMTEFYPKGLRELQDKVQTTHLIIHKILAYLSKTEVIRCQKVNRKFYELHIPNAVKYVSIQKFYILQMLENNVEKWI